LESSVRGNVHALFGGEGLVILSDQDPASYPTLFVRKTLTGLYTKTTRSPLVVRVSLEEFVHKKGFSVANKGTSVNLATLPQ
jgi:hypothetical protein